jgi:hypothetical protein
MNKSAIVPITITFHESAEDEARQLIQELRVKPMLEALNRGDLTMKERLELQSILVLVADIFNPDITATDTDPQVNLQVASRDINLGRLLKERGLARLFKLVRQKVPIDGTSGKALSVESAKKLTKLEYEKLIFLPAFQTLISPDTGSPFGTQEEFLGWVCKEAHIARSLVFLRLATYEKLLGLDIPLEQAFSIVISKPYAIREILDLIADWDHGEIIDVDPEKVVLVAQKVGVGNTIDEISELANAIYNDPDDENIKDDLINAFKPVAAHLIYEAAANPSASDALDFVRHDLLDKPEVRYRWDENASALLVDYVVKEIDETGMTIESNIETTTFAPRGIYTVRQEIIDDLLRRLPIKNRHLLKK